MCLIQLTSLQQLANQQLVVGSQLLSASQLAQSDCSQQLPKKIHFLAIDKKIRTVEQSIASHQLLGNLLKLSVTFIHLVKFILSKVKYYFSGNSPPPPPLQYNFPLFCQAQSSSSFSFAEQTEFSLNSATHSHQGKFISHQQLTNNHDRQPQYKLAS